jgi:hypothetical protein
VVPDMPDMPGSGVMPQRMDTPSAPKQHTARANIYWGLVREMMNPSSADPVEPVSEFIWRPIPQLGLRVGAH